MKKQTKILTTLFIVGICFISGFAVTQLRSESKKAEFSIDSQKEAIEYAKTLPQVKMFLARYAMRGYKEYLWAKFEEDKKLWLVVVTFQDVYDLSMAVSFDSHGKEIKIEEGMGG